MVNLYPCFVNPTLINWKSPSESDHANSKNKSSAGPETSSQFSLPTKLISPEVDCCTFLTGSS